MTVLIIILAAVLLTAGFFFLIFPRPKRFRPKSDVFEYTKYFAHRGLYDNRIVVENSLSAFRAAIKADVGIELDVRVSKDGIPVVFHDDGLGRLCGVNGEIEALNIDEIKRLKLLDTDEAIPTLKEVLDLCNGSVPLIIEMKGDGLDTSVCPQSELLLRRYGGAYCVESFNPFHLRWYKIHRPEIIRGQLATAFIKEKKRGFGMKHYLLGWMLLNFISRPDFIAYNRKYGDEKMFRFCADKLGALPVSWTVTEPKQLNEKEFEVYIFDGFLPER